jgi:hypothetical protein
MRLSVSLTALALAAAAAAPAAAQQAPSCTHTVGMVVSLTGAAGRFGHAASKSVELAFRDLNAAAAPRASRVAASRSTCATRRARGPWPSTRPVSWST